MAADIVQLTYGWQVRWVGLSGTMYESRPLMQTEPEAKELARTLAAKCLTCDASDDRAADTLYSVVFVCEEYVECPCSE